MKRYFAKLTWMLAILLGLVLMVYGFSNSTPKESCDEIGSEKCGENVSGNHISIKTISKHFLDFSK